MKLARVLGLSILFVCLVLAVLMLVEVPVITIDKFQIPNPIEVDSMVGEGIQNFYNLSLQVPESVANYRVKGEISPVNTAIQVDLWVVNVTGFEMLDTILGYGDLFKPEYPNESPYNSVKTYAKEINITSRRQFELANFDHNGTYCLLLLNFFEATQTVSVNIEEQHVQPYSRTLLERTQANMIVVGVVAALGAFLVIGKPRRSEKRARSLSASVRCVILLPQFAYVAIKDTERLGFCAKPRQRSESTVTFGPATPSR